MRPINKGPRPANYFNVDISTDANLNASLNNLNPWTFSQQVVANLFGGAPPVNVSPRDVLHAFLVYAGGAPPPPAVANVRTAKQPLSEKVASAYQQAAAPLGDRLGKFCCYCDQAAPGQLAVEHILPKAPYPLFAIAWENLLLACEICNSNKLNKPKRADMNAWAPPIVGAGPPFNPPNEEVKRYLAMRGRFLWPDTSSKPYSDFLPRLEVETPAKAWIEVTDPVHPQNAIEGATLSTRTVTGSVWMGPPYQPNPGLAHGVRVRVRLLGTSTQAVYSEQLFGLQKMGTEQGAAKISDTRMFNRTIAWFKALTLFRPIVFATQPGNQALFQYVWPQAIATAPSVGFFPVLVRVLDLLGGHAAKVPGTNVTLMEQFFHDTNNSLGFPNTDAGRMA